MLTQLYTFVESPIGDLLATGERRDDDIIITRLYTPGHDRRDDASWVRDDAAFADLRRQLGEYFAGERREFDVVADAPGTAFQRTVWAELRRIDYGRTSSYGQVALAIGAPTAARAVGGANGRNPISIIVPCHRVVGRTGTLTGYAGGLSAKSWLLAHELRHLGPAAGREAVAVALPFPQ